MDAIKNLREANESKQKPKEQSSKLKKPTIFNSHQYECESFLNTACVATIQT